MSRKRHKQKSKKEVEFWMSGYYLQACVRAKWDMAMA